ncbi:MAG: phosphotransferase [Chloroflexi bacterium]|nr:phosphotransferase [Chloroflexota bacterium]
MEAERWGKADLHIHSAAGDGIASPAEILEYVEYHTDLDLIAITDHDNLSGSMEARELAARKGYRVQVVIGSEVTTTGGHLLCYGIEERIPMLRSLSYVVKLVHERGGFVIVPHPMSWLTISVGERALRKAQASETDGLYFDGLEVINPALAGRVTYSRLLQLNRQVLRLAECAGSDSHSLDFLGTVYTRFPGCTVEDFRHALHNRTTKAMGDFWGLEEYRQLSKIAGRQMFRSLILVPGQHVQRALYSLLHRRAQ